MSARTKRLDAEKAKLAAAMCRVPLPDWVTLSRRERRRRLQLVRAVAGRG